MLCFLRKKSCPACRTILGETSIHPLFLDINTQGGNDQLILTRIADININIEKRDKKYDDIFTQLTDALEKITMSMSSFEYQNEMLRNENTEMKQLVKGLENENKTIAVNKSESSSTKEQMKAKDFMIVNLQKEVNDLKSQRAETTREMSSIREQIIQLKSTAKGEKRGPLKDVNERSQILTLKFDNLSDKL